MARRLPPAQGTLDFDAPPPADPAAEEPIVPPFPGAPAPPPPRPRADDEPLTVAALARLVERALAAQFPGPVLVSGEAAGVRFASSGHLYFTLKDEDADATVDVVVYRTNVTPRARAAVRDGAKLLVRGRPTFYAPRGRVQLVADRVSLSGRGALLEALERLKERLSKEGLFREERKRPIPRQSPIVGVVTSRTGAVIHDICRVAFRRGGAHILLAPAVVQGAGAPASICRALAELARVRGVGVIIVGRGGGSADDLSAFNDEAVVRAVAACPVPVVSAVGHEIDVTLVDFVADARAATPSQAAELVVPDAAAARALLAERRRGLARAMRGRLSDRGLALATLQRRVADPRVVVVHASQRLDERRGRLIAAINGRVEQGARARRALAARLGARDPRVVLASERAALRAVASRVEAAGARAISAREATLVHLSARLRAMSPLSVLARGYALVTRADGAAVRAPAQVAAGERLGVRVAEGTFEVEVARVEEP